MKKYIKNNILEIYFVISSLINSSLLRFAHLENSFALKPILIDFGFLMIVTSFSYLMKKKNRFKYFLILSILFNTICVVNAHYYGYYNSFASISLLATSSFIAGVSDALVKDVLHVKYFIYVWQLIVLIYINVKIKKKINIFNFKNKKIFINTIIIGICSIAIVIPFVKHSEWSRLNNLWNRESVVRSFGIYMYQIDDIIQSFTPKINNLFGHDKAYKSTIEYYENKENTTETNEYTNIFKGKNVIVIHAESIQKIAMDMEFNGEEVTPNLNKLASEGIFFDNFYSQVGVGTSSDAEFTFATSLMPSLNGTAFVNYFDRKYVTIQNLMKNQGYYVASMHANNGDFWNRKVMHQNMGYDDFYDKEYFTIDETIGLGLSDKSFFNQVIPYIEDIDKTYENYYLTLIMLSNHTPFDDLDNMDEYETTIEYQVNNQTITANPIENTTLANYFRSVHYADQAIGELITNLDNAGLLENTVVVIYGDHDARIGKSKYDLLYNYNPLTGKLYEETDENYVEFNKYDYELNKKVPFIIWTKDKQYNQKVSIPMGMIDVLPTLGNMLGVYSNYSLGTDIFSIKDNDNMVVFTDSSFLTSKIYYSAQQREIYFLGNDSIEEEYIEEHIQKADEMIEISNNIINYDLIKEIEDNND